jgi:hypothetical protein
VQRVRVPLGSHGQGGGAQCLRSDLPAVQAGGTLVQDGGQEEVNLDPLQGQQIEQPRTAHDAVRLAGHGPLISPH